MSFDLLIQVGKISPFHFPTYLGRSKGLCSQGIKDLARQQQSCLLHCNEADQIKIKLNWLNMIAPLLSKSIQY